MSSDLRARQWMYVQDLNHLKVNLDDLINILEQSNSSEWAYIVHDEDLDENGELIRPHIHTVLKFTNPQTLSHLTSMFKDKSQYFQIWKGRINNAYSYLIHATSSAIGKKKYDPEKVTASFYFVKRIKQIQLRVSNKKVMSSKVIDIFLNKYADGEITYGELEEAIGIAQLAKKKNIIDHIDQINAIKEHKQWLKQFEGHTMESLYLYGDAGVGKTRYARWLTRREEVAILGSSKDYFQEYHGEKIAILNDLRPNDFNYADLLRILDPYEHNKLAPRRYHDIYLNLEMLIITTPYSPWDFYKQCKIDNPEIDTFEQLNRRLHAIHITSKFMKEVMPGEFNQNDEWKGFM